MNPPADLYQQASVELRRGNLQQAGELAGQGPLAWKNQSAPEWYWKFRLLEAEILIARGRAKDAQALLDTPLPEKTHPVDLEIRRMMLQGNACLKLSQYERAKALLDEAEQRSRAAGFPGLLLQVEVLKGSLQIALNEMDGAEGILRQGLAHATEQGDRYYEGAALNNLGMIRIRRFRYDEAVPLFQRALSAWEQVDAWLFSSAALGNLSLCYYRLGDFDKALTFRQKAIQLQERAGALFFLQASLGEAGNIYLLQGETQQAVTYYRRALDLARQLNALSDASKWAGNLAAALIEVRDWDAGEQFNNESLELKRRIKDDRSLGYSKLNAAAIAAGRKHYDEAAGMYKDALASASGDPALLWEAHAALGSVYIAAGDQEKANRHFEQAIDIIEKTRTDLLQTDFKITFLSRLIRFYQDYVDALVNQGSYEKALRVAESSRARLLAEKLGLERAPRPAAPVRDYQEAARRSNTVLLSYWLAPRRSFVWVITPRRIESFILPPEREIASLVASYHALIQNLRDPLEVDHSAARKLYETLIAPVQALVPAGSKVFLVPDGSLHSLNLETLPVYGQRPHYWVEDVVLSTAPSLGVLLVGAPEKPRRPRSFLLIGDPESPGPDFPRLPHAGREIESIQRRVASSEKVVFTGAQAYPGVYREAHPERFSIIHFAAHASANRESPLDSGVILSRRSDTFKLYARDVANVPLNAELVTISSCRSAGARSYSGEGLVGFAWAFLHAGAHNVIAGLWDVSDNSTAQLMAQLYAELETGKSPAEALREAKLAMIRSAGNYRKPYYWGPFQVYVRGRVP